MASARAKTLALLPKFTGALSFMGSTFIFQDVVFHKRPIHRVYHRLVLGLSISDMIASVVNILSTWPTPSAYSPTIYLASGTTRTCTAQGFFNELGNVATPLYNASLCAYYVLVIRNGWAEDRIRSKAEPAMHVVPVVVASTIAILGLPFTLYNNSGWLCWIAPYPVGSPGCEDGGDCERGRHASTFRWVHYAIIWSAILFVTAGMYSIYRKVRQSERIQSEAEGAAAQDPSPAASTTRNSGEKSKKVAVQAALFVGALYLTWIFTTVARIYSIVHGRNEFVLLVLMATFFPLQGFFNCLIYLRPRYLRSKSRNRDATLRRLLWLTLHHEGHPIHGTDQQRRLPAGRQGDAVDGRGGEGDGYAEHDRRRSDTASFYSMGNSRNNRRPSDNLESDESGFDDVNTVAAIASVSDYRAKGEGEGEDSVEMVAPEKTDGRATLEAVEEATEDAA